MAKPIVELKKELEKSFSNYLSELIKLCESPIEELYLMGILQYFVDNTTNPIGFGFPSPIYDFDHHSKYTHFRCFGVSLFGPECHRFEEGKNPKTSLLKILIIPQEIIQLKDKTYRVDFAIYVEDINKHHSKLKIVVECDGHDYHHTKEQIINDNIRSRDLVSEGFHVIRYSGSELNKFNKNDFKKEATKLEKLINKHFELINKNVDFKLA